MSDEREMQQAPSEEEILTRQVEALVQSKVDEALVRYDEAQAEGVEPEKRWNLYAYGPIQPGGFRRPHRVIRAGEPFYIATILWLNPKLPAMPDVSTCEELTNLGAQFRIKYCTGEVCEWKKGPPELNVTHTFQMEPNKCWYVDKLYVPSAPASWAGCYELSICAQIIPGCGFPGKLPYAGFATAVKNLDYDLFYPDQSVWQSTGGPGEFPPPKSFYPHWERGIPTKFMIYE